MLLDKLVLGVALAAEADSALVAGMGGAGVANGADTSAIRHSPAAMLLEVSYTAQSDARFSLADGLLVNGIVAVKDTRTSDFGAGIMTTRQWSDVPPPDDELPGWKEPGTEFTDQRWEQTWRLGVGYGLLRRPLLTKEGSYEVRRLAFGGGMVYGRTVSELSGTFHTWEFDAGVAGRPLSMVAIAATLHGLGELGDEDTWGEAGLLTTLGPWTLAADGLYRPTVEQPYGFRAGVQVEVEGIALRGGTAFDRGDWRGTGGFGVVSDTVRMDYALGWAPATRAFDHTIGFFGSF